MSKPLYPIETFFNRYNLVIFIVIAALSLAGIIFICYNTFTAATTPNHAAEQTTQPITFDKETAEKIDKLRSPAEATAPDLPKNIRTNPFVE